MIQPLVPARLQFVRLGPLLGIEHGRVDLRFEVLLLHQKLGYRCSLAGSDFLTNWNGMTVGDLFTKIQDSMPADHPGQLSKPVNAEILAYMLKFNKFPAGSKELPADADALRSIRFEATSGKDKR